MSESSERIDGGGARRRTGHEEVWDLLPWYVNGTLDEGEIHRVEGHLEGCGICRPGSAWDRPRRWLAALRAAPGPLRWALAAQLAAIVILGGLLASAGGVPDPAGAEAPSAVAGEFRTLSDVPIPAVAGTRLLRVVFADQAREREIRGALIAVGGRIVDGPSPTGVYTVAVDEAGGGAAGESLRSFSQVIFAERAAVSPEVP